MPPFPQEKRHGHIEVAAAHGGGGKARHLTLHNELLRPVSCSGQGPPLGRGLVAGRPSACGAEVGSPLDFQGRIMDRVRPFCYSEGTE